MFMIPLQKNAEDGVSRDVWRDFDIDFTSLFSPLGRDRGEYAPALDVQESKDAFTVEADLPGLKKADIQVKIEDGVLVVSGTRKAEHRQEGQDKTWHRVERRWGSFERRLNLGEGVDETKVSAEYKDGVLSVTVPKKESAQPRLVDVR